MTNDGLHRVNVFHKAHTTAFWVQIWSGYIFSACHAYMAEVVMPFGMCDKGFPPPSFRILEADHCVAFTDPLLAAKLGRSWVDWKTAQCLEFLDDIDPKSQSLPASFVGKSCLRTIRKRCKEHIKVNASFLVDLFLCKSWGRTGCHCLNAFCGNFKLSHPIQQTSCLGREIISVVGSSGRIKKVSQKIIDFCLVPLKYILSQSWSCIDMFGDTGRK